MRALLDPVGGKSFKEFESFKEENGQIEIEAKTRNGQHPYVVGHYLKGRLLKDGRRVI